MLPVSLLVTMEAVKIGQGLLISWDWEIFDPIKNQEAKVSNSALLEELGQIHYLFSDKTGTLTKNEMKLKAFAIGE